MLFTEVGVLRILAGIGEGHSKNSALVGPESGAVDAGESPEEMPAAKGDTLGMFCLAAEA